MKKKAWTISFRKNESGDSSFDVNEVQQYLVRFGYLSDDFKRDTVDHQTKKAIKLFQKCNNLNATGEMNVETSILMEKPRCGVSISSDISNSSLRLNSDHGRYMKQNLTYSYSNGTSDINGTNEKQAIRNAFNTWANATGLTFTEVPALPSDFKIAWATGEHGEPGHKPFDGAGNVVAHADYPPPNGGRDSGQMHFDDDETWSISGGTNLDLEATALHEIGHLLGLGHSTDTNSVMYESIVNGRISLTADDLSRIRKLYQCGQLWHSIRQGPPWTSFQDVEGAAGEKGRFVDVACATIEDQLHVCGITVDGRLWHSIRQGTAWTSFQDVEGSAGEKGRFVNVACTTMEDQLHVCGITDDGRLWHSIRQGLPWTSFQDVEGSAGEKGRFVDVACATMGDQLHVCGITDGGKLWHSIRQGLPWTSFQDVEGAAGEKGRFVDVACATMGDQLHVCGITVDGKLWHSIRQGTAWTSFQDVEGSAGEKGHFVNVACTTMGDQLHVCGITDDGKLWHCIRQGLPWTSFQDVEGAAGEKGNFSRITCSSMNDQLHVCGVTCS